MQYFYNKRLAEISHSFGNGINFLEHPPTASQLAIALVFLYLNVFLYKPR